MYLHCIISDWYCYLAEPVNMPPKRDAGKPKGALNSYAAFVQVDMQGYLDTVSCSVCSVSAVTLKLTVPT